MKIILQITWVAFNVSVNLCMLIITAIKMTRHPINDCPNTYDHWCDRIQVDCKLFNWFFFFLFILLTKDCQAVYVLKDALSCLRQFLTI